MRFRFLIPPAAAVAVGMFTLAPRTAAEPSVAPPDNSLGADLYVAQCASCHGADGEGVVDRGPPLTREGPAAVDFVVRTGRMPLAAPNLQAKRGPVRYSEEQIVALVEFAGSLGNGPAIPDVDPARGDLAEGGEIYRLNCAACHVASGAGAAIGGGREAPSLMASSPTETGEAILVGPGAMPTFQSFTSENIHDVAAYIGDLQDRETTAVDEFGGAGPVAEGLAAWLLGLIPLIALTRWIGTPHEGRDTHAVEAPGVDELEVET